MIEFWQDKEGLTKCAIEPDSESEEHILSAFDELFARHDKKQAPDHTRREHNTFTYSLWDFANTFFQHAPGHVIAEHLKPYTSQDDYPHLDKIAQADEFFHKAYVIKHDKDTRWEYWRIYSDNYSGGQLTKMVPYKFRSQTKVKGLTVHQGEHISAPLKIGALEEFTKEIQTAHDYRDYHNFTLKNEAQKRVLTGEDMIRSRWYKRWCHPVLLFNEQPKNEVFDSITLTEEFYLDGVTHWYPRLQHDVQIIEDPFSFLRAGSYSLF